MIPRPKTIRIPLRVILCCGLASLLFITGSNGQSSYSSSYLTLVDSISIPHAAGRMDHLVYDERHHLIYVAALANNSIEILDLKNRKAIHSILGLHEPQGMAYLPLSNSIFVANGRDGECSIFNANTSQKITSIKLSGDADNVRRDSIDHLLYVGYGDGGIAVLDAIHFNLLSEIKLSGHPESFQIDRAANKIYVNVPDHQQVEVIDLKTKKVVDQWKIKEAESNYPMALDEVHHRLFIGCRRSPKLLVLDTPSGNIIASLDVDADVDDIFYDMEKKQIYLSCGAGYVDIISQSDANTYALIDKMPTAPGARTSLFIPSLHQLMIAAPSGLHKNAQLLIYQVK